MKKIIAVLFALLLAVSLVGCSSEKPEVVSNPLDETLLSPGKVIIGTSPDYPPYESLNAQGELEGFEMDMITKVVEILNEQQGTNYEIEFKQMDFSMIISALDAKQIDMGLSGFTYSPERDVIFSTSYVGSKQVVVTTKDSGIEKAEDLVGKKVAAGTGTTGDSAAQEIVGEGNVLYPGDYTSMMAQLYAGQLDAVVCDEAVGINYVNEMGLVMLEEALVDEAMSCIFKKGNDKLAAAFNQAIETFVGTDEFTALVEKWGA